jgi:hypothetical protein
VSQAVDDGKLALEVALAMPALGSKPLSDTLNRYLLGVAEELWHAFGEERRGKSAPSHPFPIGNGHPLLDNDNQVVGATDSEAFEIHAKKDTEQ